MSLLQEIEKHGLADCEFNRQLVGFYPIILEWKMPQSNVVCSLDFESISKAKKFAEKHFIGIWWQAKRKVTI